MNRREQILAAGERLLHRYGPNKTTIGDVAREVGCSVGAVYLEFDSKDAILEAISTRKHEAILDAMRAAAATNRPADERLRAAIDARVDALLAVEEGGVHATDTVHCGCPAIELAHQRFRHEELALVTEILRAGAKEGALDVGKPETAARAVVAAYVRFSPPFVWRAPRDETRTLLRAVHDVVLFGLVKRKRR